MKDSGVEWIGEIPAGWKVRKIKRFSDIRGRIGFKGYTTEDLVEPDVNGAAIVIGGTNIMADGYISFDNLTYISEYKYLESPEIMLKGGEILITKVGAGTGDSAIYSIYSDRVTINPNVMLCKPDESKVYSKYLNNFFLSSLVKEEMRLEACKSGAQPAINQGYLKNLFCTVPSIIEQKVIVDFLDKKCQQIDKTISNKEQIIEKLQNFKKSLIYECVTGKRRV